MTAERHFLHVFSTFDAGGPQVRTAQLMARLPGHRHTVVALDGRTGCAERVPADVRLEIIAVPAKMTALLQRLQPDLLLTYNWGAIETLVAARRVGMRAVVHHEEGFGPEEVDRLLRRRNWFRRFALPAARAVVVPSRKLAHIAKAVWRQPLDKVHYLPNGVDLQHYRPPAVRHPEWHLGCVARFSLLKNQPLLLRALARMVSADARLLLVGDGPQQAQCERLAVELGVAERVTFAGASRDTAPLLGKIGVFAVPSRTEQMPIAVLEAMATGLPVVATDVGDIKTMVAADNQRFVVPPDDVAALAGALDTVLADARAQRRLGDANRAKCEAEFELEQCLRGYLAVYAD